MNLYFTNNSSILQIHNVVTIYQEVEFSQKHLNIPPYTTVYYSIMDATTINIHEDTKQELDRFREYRNESYDEVIKKVVYIAKTCKTQPHLSKESIDAIER